MGLIIKLEEFNLEKTLECGQCFRFYKIKTNHYIIISRDKILEISQKDNFFDFKNIDKKEYDSYWKKYFDLETDYSKLKKEIINNDNQIDEIIAFGDGIRILNQDPLETIISFICSQNKQIPSIKQCIENICKFGDIIIYKGEKYYSFPTLDQLIKMTAADFKNCKVGFRDKYLMDAIFKIYNNEININDINNIYNNLMTINGIGPKVAACICLFSYHDFTMFPIDTWINKLMIDLFFDGKIVSKEDIIKKSSIFGINKGLAQQYLFYWAINNKDIKI